MDQIASFGFNTIRLPYSSECLAGAAGSVSGVDARLNPTLQGLTPVQIMDKVVDAAAARHLRVVLDRHRPDSGSQSELWYTDRFSEQQWIDDWVALATRYSSTPTVIGADLHNEPHGKACWGCGDPAVDWAAAATRAGNAILAVNPQWLIFVEGVEKQSTAGPTWWGGGLADVTAHPISLSVPNQVVYSPHDYPPSIFAQSWFADPAYPANLPALWDRNWGYLAQQDIAPVFLGEFGTKLATPADQAWLHTLVGYLGDRNLSFAYWSYNPNSGDTGGLVADDWATPQQAKLDELAPILGPQTPLPSPTPQPTTSQPNTSQPNTSQPTTSQPTTSQQTPSSPSQSIKPTPSAPSTAPTTASTAPPATTTSPPSGATSGSTAVVVGWRLQSSWPGGYVAQLEVTAGPNEVDGWSVSWSDPTASSVANSWGLACTLQSGEIRCRGADWAQRIPSGQTVTVGLQMASNGAAPVDPVLTIG